MLDLRKVEVRLAGIMVIDRVDLQVAAGQVCGLRGHNGAGKTTLMRAVMGLVKASAGEIRFDGKNLLELPSYARARLGIGYMPEDRRLVPTLTAEENILSPAWATTLDDAAARLTWIYEAIPELRPLIRSPSSALSGGQQKLVAMARALMAGRKLLLLDEPTEGVAPVLADRLLEILRDSRAADVAVLIAESNDTVFGKLFDKEFVLERGVLNPATQWALVSDEQVAS